MKIALYQMEIIWENKAESIYKFEKKLEELKNEKIDFILLPEMSFTGFSMNTENTKEYGSETLLKIKEVCKIYQIAIGFGWVKAGNEKSENHYTIVNREGDVLSDYVKIHPFSYSGEHEKFVGGNEIISYSLGGITFSTFICYDLRFPEVFQIASKRADVIVVPANWPAKRSSHWKCLLQARAIENQVYILAINCVGNIGGLKYSGDSCIISPTGDIIETMEWIEGVIIKDINFNVDFYRHDFPIKKDRREKLYLEMYH